MVPTAFNQNMTWSAENDWHWVSETYDGSARFTGVDYDVAYGRLLPVPYYVSTRVRTLDSNDPCSDCTLLDNFQQGPPKILGGPDNPSLARAYQNIQNGPRELIQSDGATQELRWTKGAWYLNYDPTNGTFFSWTWIPDDYTQKALESGAVPSAPPVTAGPVIGAAGGAVVGGVVRVFPLAGSYQQTQGYGCVPYNSGYPAGAGCRADKPSFHDGVDLGAPAGTPIFAAASGTVIFAGLDSTASGNSKLVIVHDGANAGFETIYLHWQKSYVIVGQKVSAGQVIAEVGSVGYSTGPHLHFSVVQLTSGATTDPLRWLGSGASVATTAPTATINPSDAAAVLLWAPFISKAAADRGVPAPLLAAIMTIESDGNRNAVSPQGAQGLMQVMPSEFQRLGVPVDKWLEPATNIDAAARLLAETLSTGGSVQLAITRYFGVGCDALGTCTDVYLAKALQWYAFYQAALPK